MTTTAARSIPTSGAFGIDAENMSGLNLRIKGGTVTIAGTFSQVPNVELAMANNTVNYVEQNAVGVVTSNTVGFTSGRSYLYKVTTSGGKITSIADWRSAPHSDPDAPGGGATAVSALGTGTAANVGNAVLVAGTVTIATTVVTATTVVLLSRKVFGGTMGFLSYSLIAGTSITITSANVADTSTVTWMLVETR